MMAHAGAILMSLGRKPDTQRGNGKKEVKLWHFVEKNKNKMSQDWVSIYLPANSPVKPFWATIRLITPKVDEETSVDTEKKK